MKPSGALLVKCFNGTGYNEILGKFKETFKTVSHKKPKASREKSSEVFLLGKSLKTRQ
jgi:23S rRNA (uridine2552-2'-O)-methyltransferase